MQRNILKKVYLLIILGTGLIVLSSKLRGSYEIPDLLNAQERDQHFSPVNPFSPSQNVVSMPNEKLKTIFPVNPFSLGQNVTPVPNEKLNRETTMLNFRAFDQRISTEHSKDLTQSGQQKPEQQTNPPAHQTNPPPKQKNPPPKQTNPPPKQTNPPPKQKNPPPKQKNPPPKQKNPQPKQKDPPPKQKNPPPKQKNTSLKQNKSTGAAQSNLHLRKDLFTANCLPTPPFPPPPRVPQEDSTAPHILVNDGGRLGNKVCQYYSVYLLRHLFGAKVSITGGMNATLSKVFQNISLPVGNRTNTTRIKYDKLYKLLYEAGMREANISGGIVQGLLLPKSYYIYNNPCPKDLFMKHRSLLRSVLVYKDDILDRAKNNIDKALSHRNLTLKDATMVTAHVRRTDYIKYIKKCYNLTTLDHVYYERAFEFFRQRIVRLVFVVVSDDLEWCRKNLQADDVLIAGSKSAVVDQAVLTYGAHTITSYGTFSFIGALLAGGHITHPINNNTKYKSYNCVRSLDFHFISRDKDYYYPNS